MTTGNVFHTEKHQFVLINNEEI